MEGHVSSARRRARFRVLFAGGGAGAGLIAPKNLASRIKAVQ